MQKEKINIIIQATYNNIEYGLYLNTKCVEKNRIIKTKAHSLLMPELNETLANNNINWDNISFIGASTGPAPFTTLRTLITTLNGINFAKKIPLIGLNGLETFAQSFNSQSVSVVLYNAFSKDIYYAINNNSKITFGWDNEVEFLEKLAIKYPKNIITFYGNAVEKLRENITEKFKNRSNCNTETSDFLPLETLAKKCHLLSKKKEAFVNQLTPLYLKNFIY